MTTNARLIRAERFPEMAEVIQRDGGLIIERWSRRAGEEQPSAPRVHHEALRDHLPSFLHELASHLAEAGNPDSCPHCRPAVQHGEQRWEVGWSLSEVIRDYRILRLVLLDHLDRSLDRPLRANEAQAVGLALDEAIEASVERYVKSRDDQFRQLQEDHAEQSRKAEQELMRWKEVFLQASWGVAIVHPTDYTFLAVNPAFARMHGHAAGELLGKPLAGVLAPDFQARLPELLGPALEKGHHTYEAVHHKKDSSNFPVLTEATVYRDEKGAPLFWAATYQDISHRKAMEDSLREQAEALREADRRKNDFLATLAHELRNPLAPLRNSLDAVRLAGEAAGPGLFQQVREIMERQVGQMTRLVEDLLDMTRIAQGKLVLKQERLDLRTVLEQAAQMNAPLRKTRRHHFSIALPPEPLWVEGDPARLVQVVVNLLNNATKYTPDEGRISLNAACEDGSVLVRVQDNGIGIPAEKLPHIFDLYSQLDLGPERTEGGLGIGLTLVRKLVESHGGTIAATSAGLGQGSEFVVRLPAAVAEPEVAVSPAKGPLDIPSRHVLIVEDNADGRESLAVLLRLLGHRVDVAEDGRNGVEAALALKPELALIDIGLPLLDGYEVAQEVRKGLGDSVLLVALTGHGQPEDRQRSAQAGFDAHLTKPVELEALQALLAGGRVPPG